MYTHIIHNCHYFFFFIFLQGDKNSSDYEFLSKYIKITKRKCSKIKKKLWFFICVHLTIIRNNNKSRLLVEIIYIIKKYKYIFIYLYKFPLYYIITYTQYNNY